jgi:hypothetical protein
MHSEDGDRLGEQASDHRDVAWHLANGRMRTPAASMALIIRREYA